MRVLEIEKQDACVYLGGGLCQLNMCSGRIMMPRGGAPEMRAGSTSKKALQSPTPLCVLIQSEKALLCQRRILSNEDTYGGGGGRRLNKSPRKQ